MCKGAILSAVLLLGLTYARSEDTNPQGWKRLILSENETDLSEAQKQLLNHYRDTVRVLISVVQRPLEDREQFYIYNNSRNHAIYVLGKMRAKEAVPHLVLWLVPRKGQVMVVDRLMRYGPAGYALLEIGLPAVPVLVDTLKKEGVSPLGQECATVLADIRGKLESWAHLRAILKEESDVEARRNLADAASFLAKGLAGAGLR